MLILDLDTNSLRVRLTEAHVTTSVKCMTSFRQVDATTFTPLTRIVPTNGTTGVEVMEAPTDGYQNVCDYINILNTDTVNHGVVVYVYNGSSNFDLVTVTLGPNERLEYTDSAGFNVYNSAGALKTIVTATQNALSTGWSTSVLASDVTNANATANTIADVTGLSFPVVAGTKYWFEFFINFTVPATSTGSRWTINGPGSPTLLSYRSEYPLSTTTRTLNDGLVAYDQPSGANASSGNSLGNIAKIEGIIQPSADGTVIARFASEVSSSALVAKAGSIVRYTAV